MTTAKKLKHVTLYVVAINQSEADGIADDHGHTNRFDAEQHLAEIKAPPTDPFYAQQYKIYEVRR